MLLFNISVCVLLTLHFQKYSLCNRQFWSLKPVPEIRQRTTQQIRSYRTLAGAHHRVKVSESIKDDKHDHPRAFPQQLEWKMAESDTAKAQSAPAWPDQIRLGPFLISQRHCGLHNQQGLGLTMRRRRSSTDDNLLMHISNITCSLDDVAVGKSNIPGDNALRSVW